MRLNKFLAKAGVASRRKCDRIVKNGRVQVNGIGVTDPYVIIQPDDEVICDGKSINLSEERIVILLNKPPGVITTMSDTHNRPTVMDLIQYHGRLFPVGRLDKETTGALLLTNDGNLAFRLTHPKFKIQKLYEVSLDKPLKQEDKNKIKKGVDIGDGEIGKAVVLDTKLIQDKIVDRFSARILLHHGKKREIRRIFSTLGYIVLKLKRIEIAGIGLNDLPEGQWRILSKEEIGTIIPDSA